MHAGRALSVVAGISLVYDLAIGLALLAATDRFASLFGVVVPEPRTFVTLLGVFLVCVGLGYLQPMRDPARHRAYMWIFGVLLKTAGAAVFIGYYIAGDAPSSYLLFAATDGSLALATLAAIGLPIHLARKGEV
ncbi:MAG: hypothetical protein EXQ49_03035 [Acidobacteria bacterium]|nr:hypothetical protein [Acidobacteriota bacterium]